LFLVLVTDVDFEFIIGSHVVVSGLNELKLNLIDLGLTEVNYRSRMALSAQCIGFKLDVRGVVDRFPTAVRDFSFLRLVYTKHGAHRISH
jgi:hypothetical protein